MPKSLGSEQLIVDVEYERGYDAEAFFEAVPERRVGRMIGRAGALKLSKRFRK